MLDTQEQHLAHDIEPENIDQMLGTSKKSKAGYIQDITCHNNMKRYENN